MSNESDLAMKDENDMENLEPLDDSFEERMFARLIKGLEPDMTFQEAAHYRMDHAIKLLARRRGWIQRKNPKPTENS